MMKRVFALLLALVMVLALAACGGQEKPTEPDVTEAPVADATDPAQETEAPTEAPTEASGLEYIINLVDEGGNPLAGVMVQLCEGTNCVPMFTDADGKAVFSMEKEADYEAKVSAMPEGYDYTTEEQVFHFEAGSKELTIVLKAIA